jgi:hypothetical protein
MASVRITSPAWCTSAWPPRQVLVARLGMHRLRDAELFHRGRAQPPAVHTFVNTTLFISVVIIYITHTGASENDFKSRCC